MWWMKSMIRKISDSGPARAQEAHSAWNYSKEAKLGNKMLAADPLLIYIYI